MKMYEFSLKFVPKVPIDNIPALDLIMAWRQLPEPLMVSLLTYICVTLPQGVKLTFEFGPEFTLGLKELNYS